VLPAWALLEAAAAAGALAKSDGAAGAMALTAASLGGALPLPPAEDRPERAEGATLRVGVRTGAVSAWPAGSPDAALLAATLASAHACPAERGGAGPAGGRAAPRAPLSALAIAAAAAAAARAARAPRRAACLASMQPHAGAAGGQAAWPAPAAAEAALALQTIAERLPGHAGALGPALTLTACAACMFGPPAAEPGPTDSARHTAVSGEPAARWCRAPRARAAVQDAGGGLVLVASGAVARRGPAADAPPDDADVSSSWFTTMWQRVEVPQPAPAVRRAHWKACMSACLRTDAVHKLAHGGAATCPERRQDPACHERCAPASLNVQR
jgi:hypothetical protein